MTQSKSPRIAVIGGGISGLSAANYCREQCPNAKISIFEKRERLGGVLHTEITDGLEIEQSVDNFITTSPYGLELCRRLGLESRLVTTTPRHRQTFILWKNRLHKLPDGFMMMAPTKWWPMAVTRLLTPFGKLRAAMEYFIPAKKDDSDESLEAFAVRRLGREVFERLIEPLVSGVYAADMKRLSLMATLPRFREMEKKHRSLIRAMRANSAEAKKKARAERKAASSGATSGSSSGSSSETSQSGPRYNLFVTLKGGLNQIVDEIEKRLDPALLHCGTQVVALQQGENGKWIVSWRKLATAEQVTQQTAQQTTQQSAQRATKSATEPDADQNADPDAQSAEAASVVSEEFDGVILATESHGMVPLLESASIQRAAQLLAGIEYNGTLILTVAFRREDVGHPLDGMGTVVPAIEKNPVLAISFSNEKYPHRAPEGVVLLRIFSGGLRNPEVVSMPDQEVEELLIKSITPCLKIHGKPIHTSISRWPNAMPQLHFGHLERIKAFQEEMSSWSTLAVAGNFLRGVGLPYCIQTGEEAAQKLLKYFNE